MVIPNLLNLLKLPKFPPFTFALCSLLFALCSLLFHPINYLKNRYFLKQN